MAVDEDARYRLRKRLVPVIGEEEAGTLPTGLVPAGEQVLTASAFEARMALFDARFEALEARLESRIDQRIADLTRTLLVANTGLVLTSTGLAFAAARFAGG